MREHQIQFKVAQIPFGCMEEPSFNSSMPSIKGKVKVNPLHGLSVREISFKYSALIVKARKCLDNVRHYVDVKDYDNQRFYFHKCLDFYKKALSFALSEMKKARIHFQMGSTFIHLAGV